MHDDALATDLPMKAWRVRASCGPRQTRSTGSASSGGGGRSSKLSEKRAPLRAPMTHRAPREALHAPCAACCVPRARALEARALSWRPPVGLQMACSAALVVRRNAARWPAESCECARELASRRLGGRRRRRRYCSQWLALGLCAGFNCGGPLLAWPAMAGAS